MDVSDVGSRPEVERVEEGLWLGRMQSHAPGMDPETNRREHSDLVATAAPTAHPVPVESDGSILGGEKERVLAQVWVDSGMPPLEPSGDPVFVASDPYDMHTPIGTPEGARPAKGEVW